MLINELKPSQAKVLSQSNWESSNRIMSWLDTNGFTVQGSGLFSVVYSNANSNAVVKVSKRSDACWLKFAAFAQQNKGNVHLPKISRIMKYNVGSQPTKLVHIPEEEQEFFIAFIEKLEPMRAGRNITSDDYEGLNYLGDWFRGEFDPGDWTKAHPSQRAGRLSVKQTDDKRMAYRYAKENPVLFKTLHQFRGLIKTECQMDTHFQNFMIRKSTGDIVIVDPVSFPL